MTKDDVCEVIKYSDIALILDGIDREIIKRIKDARFGVEIQHLYKVPKDSTKYRQYTVKDFEGHIKING